jgi:hypothetical protein
VERLAKEAANGYAEKADGGKINRTNGTNETNGTH